MAVEAGGVEGEHAVGPIEGLVAAIGKMPHAAGRHVVPRLLVDVVGQGQHLQAAAIQGREEVIDVLSAHHVGDRILASSPPGRFLERARPRRSPRGTCVCRSTTSPCCGRQVRLGKRRGVRLHGQAVPRGGPELVELLVAILAGLRAGIFVRSPSAPAAVGGVSVFACFGAGPQPIKAPTRNTTAGRLRYIMKVV